jgi:hypothetical protein
MQVPLFLRIVCYSLAGIICTWTNEVHIEMGERSAVRPKSGQSVYQSDPGLRRPKPPSTAGRKPAARPPISILSFTPPRFESMAHEVGTDQPKTGRGAGQSPVVPIEREAPKSIASLSPWSALLEMSDSELSPLIQYIKILDRWDKEAHEKHSI